MSLRIYQSWDCDPWCTTKAVARNPELFPFPQSELVNVKRQICVAPVFERPYATCGEAPGTFTAHIQIGSTLAVVDVGVTANIHFTYNGYDAQIFLNQCVASSSLGLFSLPVTPPLRAVFVTMSVVFGSTIEYGHEHQVYEYFSGRTYTLPEYAPSGDPVAFDPTLPADSITVTLYRR